MKQTENSGKKTVLGKKKMWPRKSLDKSKMKMDLFTD